MKFMNKFQRLMGGNATVQFQHSSLVTQSSSSLVLLENTTNNDDASSSSIARDHKKKKLKKKKQKKIKDGKVIKVFKPDGEINVYKKAIKVSEFKCLMPLIVDAFGNPYNPRRHLPFSSSLYDDKLAYEYIEDRFGQFGYNRAKLYKDKKYDHIGKAKLRFTSQAARDQAWNHAVDVMRLKAKTWFN